MNDNSRAASLPIDSSGKGSAFSANTAPKSPIGPSPLAGILAMPVGIALVLVIDQFVFAIPNQPGVLICFIAAAGFYGGLRIALFSLALYLAFTIWFFSGTDTDKLPVYFRLELTPSIALEYTKASFNRIVVFLVVAPIVAIVVGYLRMRLQAETRKVQLAIEELKKSNAELERFAYVASHDLQEPLRAISGCVQLLERGYREKLDAKASELIGHTVEGVARMKGLIDDLLAYSRVVKTHTKLKPLDLQAMLAQAQRNLEAAIAESAAVIDCDKLPTVHGDPTQLTLLFQNLLGNAIKFRGTQAPLIHVFAERQPGFWKIGVRDNGIGIDQQYFERIFDLFQRLHTRDVYPGTGLGLSICQKIVRAHGGEIWLESTVGQGTTFFFTFPDQLLGNQ